MKPLNDSKNVENEIRAARTIMTMRSVKTTMNWLRLMAYKYTPIKAGEKDLEDICNYFRYSENLSSSGQPAQNQFKTIQRAGYAVVINLATNDFIEFPVDGEAEIVTQLGMKYVHIPVDFFNPGKEDFVQFVKVMKPLADEKVWVHCSANARASSFIYKYRCTVLGEDSEDALWDLREIWEPFGPWRSFVFNQERFV